MYEKGKQDYVTTVDRQLDRLLTAGFADLFPEDGVISEENADSWQQFSTAGTSASQRLWLIDPLDGTNEFIAGKPNYAVLAGLLVDHRPVAGWVYAPVFDQLYYGGPDFGLWLAVGTAAPVPLLPQLPAPPSVGFCPILIGSKDRRRYGEAITQRIPAAQFDCIGSFGLKVLRVVQGQAGLYIYLNRRVKLWDTTGPLALAEAAGLICCDLAGESLRFTPDAVEATTLRHQQPILIGWESYIRPLLPLLQQALPKVV